MQVKWKSYKMLDGSEQVLIQQIGDGDIIRRFDKTPYPIGNSDVVCPHFLEMAWSYGCPFDCAWCYLKGTYRFFKDEVTGRIPPHFKDRRLIYEATKTFIRSESRPEILNAGELSDCYDDKTEILTEDGWKPFEKLAYEDKVATLSQDNELVYQNPTNIIKEWYEGPMYQVETKEIDQCVTPNHKLWVARRAYLHHKGFGDYEFIRAEQSFGKRVKHKKDCKWRGEEKTVFYLPGDPEARYKQHRNSVAIDMDSWLEFLGFWLPEGNVFVRKKRNYHVEVAKSRDKKREVYDRIMRSLEKLPFKFKPAAHGFYCDNRNLALYLSRLGKDQERFIPKEFKMLSSRQLKILLEPMMITDASNGQYYTTSKRLADDVQEILLKVGVAGNIGLRKQQQGGQVKGRTITPNYDLYTVYVVTRYLQPTVNHGHSKGKHERWIDYCGWIYCCTVPDHIVCVRRNGKPIWSGNSLMGEALQPEPWSCFIQRIVEGSQHKVLYLSKGLQIQNFLKNEWQKNAILAWSINEPSVANTWERLAPDPPKRLDVAKQVYDAGYQVRLRIDPIVPVLDYQAKYRLLVDEIFKRFTPERITLGTLRGLVSTLAHTRNHSWKVYLENGSGWGKKPGFQIRLEMYQTMIDYLNSYGFRKVGICKDTIKLWRTLGLRFDRVICNCVA